MISGPPTGKGPVFTVSVAPFWSKTLRLGSRTPDTFLFTKASTPLLWTRTEGKLLPWPPTTVPRTRTQSPRRERCLPRAILTPRPKGHSPSCRISLWGVSGYQPGYIYRPPLTTSLLRANSDTSHHFRHYRRLHLPLSEHQWASESSTSPYMSNTVLWPPASVVPLPELE